MGGNASPAKAFSSVENQIAADTIDHTTKYFHSNDMDTLKIHLHCHLLKYNFSLKFSIIQRKAPCEKVCQWNNKNQIFLLLILFIWI